MPLRDRKHPVTGKGIGELPNHPQEMGLPFEEVYKHPHLPLESTSKMPGLKDS